MGDYRGLHLPLVYLGTYLSCSRGCEGAGRQAGRQGKDSERPLEVSPSLFARLLGSKVCMFQASHL